MGPLSRWAVRKPWWALGAWLLLVVIIGVMGTAFKGTLNDSFSLPDTDSLQAQELLEKLPAGRPSEATTATAKIVWSPRRGHRGRPGHRGDDGTAAHRGRPRSRASSCVTNPVQPHRRVAGPAPAPQVEQPTIPTNLPPEQAKALKDALARQPEGAVAGQPGRRTWPSRPSPSPAAATVPTCPTDTAKQIIDLVKTANAKDGLQVGANGQVLEFAGPEPPSSEAIGMLVALIILLIAFGSMHRRRPARCSPPASAWRSAACCCCSSPASATSRPSPRRWPR